MMWTKTGWISLFITLAVLATGSARADTAGLEQAFLQPPDDARIMVRYWWFGPAVTHTEIARELETMKQGGIGGVEVQPTYPMMVNGQIPGLVNLKFMSPEFLDAIRFTALKAKQIGMRMDLTLGSGWPYGGPMFPRSEGAGRLRVDEVAVARGQATARIAGALDPAEHPFAAFAVSAANPQQINYGAMKEIPLQGATVTIPAELQNGPVDVLFFISSQTRMQVKRPTNGAEGYVIDHLDPNVVDHFIKVIAEPEIDACGENPPFAIFCDSLEVGGEDWTPNFMAEFQKRRGYDLRPLLPHLYADIDNKTWEIRHDWGQTLTELFNDNFVAKFQALAKAHKSKFRIQAYGSPSAGEHTYASADLAEGEGYQWHGYASSRYAASADHLLGITLASSETFTWLHNTVFRAVPLDMKAESSMHFLQGINQITCHGYPYDPTGIAYPGFAFYAAAVFNDNNPWWIVMPDVTRYLQRVSTMMRQGQPANDVAVYLANADGWANFAPGSISLTNNIGGAVGGTVAQLLDAGYNVDFFDDQLLALRGKVDNGNLAFGALRYPIVVLTDVERIPPATIQKLEEFARGGGLVVAIGSIPSLAPGHLATAADQQTVKDTADRLFRGDNHPGAVIANVSLLKSTLAKRLGPDVTFAPAAPASLGFVHRHTDGGEVYFVANVSNQKQYVSATFRTPDGHAELWDPVSGKIAPATSTPAPGGQTVPLKLEPYQTALVVFTSRTLPVKPAPVVTAPAPIDLSTGWKVTFAETGISTTMDKLHSWADDAATKGFSGTATYEKQITVPADLLKDGLSVAIDFGQGTGPAGGGRGRGGSGFTTPFEPPIHEVAIVYVNGQRAGTVWAPPYSVDLTGTLKPGDNTIDIDVANTAVNYGVVHGLPDFSRAVQQFGNRAPSQDLRNGQIVPSGLLGPIKLVASPIAQQ
jgi:hypothetical protein